MKYLVMHEPKLQYTHLRSSAIVVEASSKAAALREARKVCDAFEPEYTHKAPQVTEFNEGVPFYI